MRQPGVKPFARLISVWVIVATWLLTMANCGGTTGLVILSSEPIPGTFCIFIESPVQNVQCIFLQSQDDTTNNAINLPELIDTINTFLASENLEIGTELAIESVAGNGSRGNDVFPNDGGGGGDSGYAITVQTLNTDGEISLPTTTVSTLYLYVGKAGSRPSSGGGDAGSSSTVIGQAITSIPSNAILLPTGGADEAENDVPDQLVFVIAGGGGGGGGADFVGGDGRSGGPGGSMGELGPQTVGNTTVPGGQGDFNNANSGGSADGSGEGGQGNGSNGNDGIGGLGGSDTSWQQSTITDSDWSAGQGGSRGGDDEGGGGGGGWGGGGGGDVTGGDNGFGGGGGGTFARQSVSTGSKLTTLFNQSGGNVTTNTAQVVLTFNLVSTN